MEIETAGNCREKGLIAPMSVKFVHRGQFRFPLTKVVMACRVECCAPRSDQRSFLAVSGRFVVPPSEPTIEVAVTI